MKTKFLSKINILIASLLAAMGFMSCNQPVKYGVPYEEPIEDKYGVPYTEYIEQDEPSDDNAVDEQSDNATLNNK